ncbi:MAG: hypothetical protein JWM95_2454 [Gemmatimonadetes bacterium]|nr:hypothetical protein [Gemmatimonadota bacterium]
MRSASLLLIATLARGQDATPRPAGHALTGLPALNFDADEGFGTGAILQYYDYGTAGVAPYRFSVQPTVFGTTRGRRDIVVFLDAPHLLPTGWRLGAGAAREQQLATPYYGIGNESQNDTLLSRAPNPYYYRFGRTVVRANADVQHRVGLPTLRFLAGAGVRSVTIRPVPYDSGSTLLAQRVGRADLPATHAISARMGLVFDTRDREIGTHAGNWSELIVQRVAGDEDYTRTTASVRQYVPIGGRVTLAERVVMQTVRGDPSIGEMFIVQSSYRDDEILGGASSIRGIPRNRYVGKGVAFANTEVRWDAAQFAVRGRTMGLVVSGFTDAGRVWTDGVDVSTMARDLHVGCGGGVRLAIGPSFVIATDVGHSAQSTAAVYIGLGYLF